MPSQTHLRKSKSKLIKPQKLAKLVLLLGFLSAILTGFLVINSSFESFLPAQASQFQDSQILDLVNTERQKFNLPRLKSNSKLNQAARLKAKNMADNNYFAHISPSGKKWSDFILESGYNYTVAGENLARNHTTTQSVVKAWLESPTHRENILNPRVKETGIAINDSIKNGNRNIYIVQNFASLE